MIAWALISKIGNTDMNNLLTAVHGTIGVDLSDYAQSSLQRRIIRFNEIARIASMDELVKKIRSESGFAVHFINEITVNVSEMFRDPSFWEIIRDSVLTELSNRSVINIWHAGCSQGEEVFTMAIILKEAGLLSRSRIVATDININALKFAESGIFFLKSQELNQKNYALYGGKGLLSDYYKVVDNKAYFDRELIKKVEFKKHDLSSDQHFACFDLIICRNVFIYFNLNLQERALAIFNQSLLKDSFLGIGSKESIAYCKGARYLNPLSLDEKIFRKM